MSPVARKKTSSSSTSVFASIFAIHGPHRYLVASPGRGIFDVPVGKARHRHSDLPDAAVGTIAGWRQGGYESAIAFASARLEV
jgi:hypothetical protein